VLEPEYAGSLAVERFVRAVRLLSRVAQPNIVPIVGGGDAEGSPYYVMSFIDAPSLRERLASGTRLSLAQAMHVLRDVAKAMTYAHAQGVVHHDLTPVHVLLSGDTVMVSDFGIAPALASAAASADSRAGRRGAAARRESGTPTSGNPAYRSPEQVGAGMSDLRADLYAWGVLAYELITGTHPFGERESLSGEPHVGRSEVAAPIGRGNPALPAALASVVMRCLEREPDKRPVSAADLIVALDSASRPHATPVGPVAVRSTAEGSPAEGGATRWFVGLAALVVLAAVAWMRSRG
jgi:serine/threonine-protein kinase